MFELNKYCFFSTMIDGHIMVFNSQKNTKMVLTSEEYNSIVNYINKKHIKETKIENLKLYSDIIIERSHNGFNKELFNQKIKLIRKGMNSFVTFLVIMENNYNGIIWEINSKELENCIIAIKKYCEKIKNCNLMIILQYHNKPTSTYHQEIIFKILGNLDYSIDIRVLSDSNIMNCNSENHKYSSEIQSYRNFNCSVSNKLLCNIDALNSHKSKYIKRSVKNYINGIENLHLFKTNISMVDILCPNLMERFYIIEHGKLIKKCLSQSAKHDNIVGARFGQTIILNENINNYIMSINKLNETCFECRYVYVCMGQNCKNCFNENTVLCMPLGKFIKKNLDNELKEYLRMLGGEASEKFQKCN